MCETMQPFNTFILYGLEVLQQRYTAFFLPVEGALTQSQTQCYGNALSGLLETLQERSRSHPAPDRYYKVPVTLGAYIWHRKVMQCLIQ